MLRGGRAGGWPGYTGGHPDARTRRPSAADGARPLRGAVRPAPDAGAARRGRAARAAAARGRHRGPGRERPRALGHGHRRASSSCCSRPWPSSRRAACWASPARRSPTRTRSRRARRWPPGSSRTRPSSAPPAGWPSALRDSAGPRYRRVPLAGAPPPPPPAEDPALLRAAMLPLLAAPPAPSLAHLTSRRVSLQAALARLQSALATAPVGQLRRHRGGPRAARGGDRPDGGAGAGRAAARSPSPRPSPSATSRSRARAGERADAPDRGPPVPVARAAAGRRRCARSPRRRRGRCSGPWPSWPSATGPRAASRSPRSRAASRCARGPTWRASATGCASARADDRVSPAALETLAVVAYLEPISRPQISRLRGVVGGLHRRVAASIAGCSRRPVGRPTAARCATARRASSRSGSACARPATCLRSRASS